MLSTIVVILVVLWALGFIGGFVSSSLVHLLLVIVLVLFILRLLSGRRIL